MDLLIAQLFFIGFWSPAYSVTVDTENQKSNEHLISLRDYDFVGEDQRLSALLAERMAVLQAPLNLSDLEDSSPAPEPAGSWPEAPSILQLKPDYLHSNVRIPQLVNVSMDYAEIVNASDWLLDVNASLLALEPKPGGAPAPGYGRVPAPGRGWPHTPGPGGALAPGARSAPASSHAERINRVDGRRQIYLHPSDLDYNNKILDLMKQSIYTAQRKVLEIDPLVKRHERDPRFRMAFIYNRLDEWLSEMRNVLHSTMKYRYYPRRFKRVIWYYENTLRLNIDITYTIDHLLHLNFEYVKNMDIIVSPAQRLELQAMKLQQKKFKKMNELGLNQGPITTTPPP